MLFKYLVSCVYLVCVCYVSADYDVYEIFRYRVNLIYIHIERDCLDNI